MFLEQAALKGPLPEGIIDLVNPVRDCRGDVTTRRIPFHVRRHEMLLGRHHRHVWKYKVIYISEGLLVTSVFKMT